MPLARVVQGSPDRMDDETPSSDRSLAEAARPLRDGGRPIASLRTVDGLVTIAEAVFATASGPPPPARLDWLAIELEDFLARAGARTRFVLWLARLAVAVLAPLSIARFVPLARLPVAERSRALSRLEHSFLGAPVLAVKALLCVLYYEHPDAAREVGFDGKCLTSVRQDAA